MSFNEARKIALAIRNLDSVIPLAVNDMGQLALNHFTKSFREQGFTDESFEHWKPRKRERDNGRAILVKTGQLRRSIRKIPKGRYAVSIVSNVPYARVHNDGARSGRGRGFIMPKREFIGYSGQLNKKIIQKINLRVRSILK